MYIQLALFLASFSIAQPSFTGLWYRLDSQSDDPEERIEAALRGFVEKETRGERTADDVDPQLLARIRGALDSFVLYPEELHIEESERELVLDHGGPRLRIYYLDGEEHERQMPNGTRLATTATRIGSQVDVFQETDDGAEVYETYLLSDDGERMTLTVRLEDEQLKAPLVIESVYTRAD